jgi:hypothetical protein
VTPAGGPAFVTLEFDDGSSVYGELQNAVDTIDGTPLAEIVVLERNGNQFELQPISGKPRTVEELPDLNLKIALGQRVLELPLAKVRRLKAKLVEQPVFSAKFEIQLFDGEQQIASRSGRCGNGGLQPLRTTVDGQLIYDQSVVARGKHVVRVRAFDVTRADYSKLLFADARQKVLLMGSRDLAVFDTVTKKAIQKKYDAVGYSDMSLSPDGNVAYILGGQPRPLGDNSSKWQKVYRLDLTKNELEETDLPTRATSIAAISHDQFAILVPDGLTNCTLNRWPTGGNVEELHRISCGSNSNLIYDPFRSRLLAIFPFNSQCMVQTFGVTRTRLTAAEKTQQLDERRGACSLSADGRSLYVGRLQLEAGDIMQKPARLEELVLAAGAELAITAKGIVGLEIGEKIETFPQEIDAAAVAQSGNAFTTYSRKSDEVVVFEIIP